VGDRATRLIGLLALAVVAWATTACSAEEVADPATTTSAASLDPACQALERLAAAWSFSAAPDVIGNPERLRAASAQAQAEIGAAIDEVVADPTIPPDVAAHAEAVRIAGIAFLQTVTDWATNDDPSAVPTLAPGTSDAQRALDGWALERCGTTVWG